MPRWPCKTTTPSCDGRLIHSKHYPAVADDVPAGGSVSATRFFGLDVVGRWCVHSGEYVYLYLAVSIAMSHRLEASIIEPCERLASHLHTVDRNGQATHQWQEIVSSQDRSQILLVCGVPEFLASLWCQISYLD